MKIILTILLTVLLGGGSVFAQEQVDFVTIPQDDQVDVYELEDAVRAYESGTATALQLELLESENLVDHVTTNQSLVTETVAEETDVPEPTATSTTARGMHWPVYIHWLITIANSLLLVLLLLRNRNTRNTNTNL